MSTEDLIDAYKTEVVENAHNGVKDTSEKCKEALQNDTGDTCEDVNCNEIEEDKTLNMKEVDSKIPEQEANADKLESDSKLFHNEEKQPHSTEEDGWLDIFGSGDFKKKVIKAGNGQKVEVKSLVTVNYTCCDNKSSDVIEQAKNFQLIVGDLDLVKGLDLAVPIMEHGETAEILVPARLAYGKVGRPPDIPSECDLLYTVEILKVEEMSEDDLTTKEIIEYGNKKRDRGNFWYGLGDYISALHCYKRAEEFLDAVQDGSDSSSEVLQDILDTRIKVYNNMAAAHLKLEAYDQALKSVDFVLRIQSKNVKALYRKSKILSTKGFTDEAVAVLKKASELEPENKVIQQDLSRLSRRKKIEDNCQKEMYKRMFPQSKSKPSKLRKWMTAWSVMAGSCVAFAVGVATYRQYFS